MQEESPPFTKRKGQGDACRARRCPALALDSALAGEGCDCHHGAFLPACRIELEDGLLSTINPDDDLALGKVHVGVVVGFLALSLDTTDYNGEISDWWAEEMRPTVKRVFGAEVTERPVSRDPIILIRR